MKKTWKTINEKLRRNKVISELPSTFLHDNLELTDPIVIANAFNTHFANIGKTLSSQIENSITSDKEFTQYLNMPSLKSCKFKCVSQAEVMTAIDNIENKNSSGHDGISNKILKFIKFEISNSLALINNQMITTGIFPESFKTSKIVQLFKKGESPLLTNYRPISLLPTISKIFERIIHDQMYAYLNSNNLVAEQQYGFRKLHSAEYAAMNLINHVAKQMESGHTLCNLCIDLSKAFDTLSLSIYC